MIDDNEADEIERLREEGKLPFEIAMQKVNTSWRALKLEVAPLNPNFIESIEKFNKSGEAAAIIKVLNGETK
jgi:hypothetical protein